MPEAAAVVGRRRGRPSPAATTGRCWCSGRCRRGSTSRRRAPVAAGPRVSGDDHRGRAHRAGRAASATSRGAPSSTCSATTAALDRMRVGRAYIGADRRRHRPRPVLGGRRDAGRRRRRPDPRRLPRRRAPHRLAPPARRWPGCSPPSCRPAPRARCTSGRRARGGAEHTLRAGAELLGWAAGTRDPAAAPRRSARSGRPASRAPTPGASCTTSPAARGAHRILPAIRDRDAASADRRRGRAPRTTASGGLGRVVRHRCSRTSAPATWSSSTTSTGPPATYRVLRARHQIDGGGFRTTLELEAA